MEPYLDLLEWIGASLLLLGGFFELIGAVGVLRFPDFFSRIHAATASAIGGTIVPLIGLALILTTRFEMGWSRMYLAFLCIVSAILILVIAPAGSHALIRAAYISRARRTGVYDEVTEEIEREER